MSLEERIEMFIKDDIYIIRIGTIIVCIIMHYALYSVHFSDLFMRVISTGCDRIYYVW